MTVEGVIARSAENVPPQIRSVHSACAGGRRPTLATQGMRIQSLAQLLAPGPEPIIELTGELLLPLSVNARDLLFAVDKCEISLKH